MAMRGPRLEFAVGAFLLLTLASLLVLAVDPTKFDSIVTLSLDTKYKDLPADTSAGIFTSGLLGESYIGLQPGGDPDTLKPGDEIGFTQPA
ncbi:mammalian cell entry protein, partial [Xanthomonas perforans]|uniref:MlaD family protein n=1 Tax=Xanthomonas perforans TaxID=442694 RepID=UPI00062D60D1